ncbi:hypothetical protein F4819DRAFT_490647 [Hypoxylon fuscum]|nr:hypothetical protein F4819DRAFT_490647 [Hypoxylon fuscum]
MYAPLLAFQGLRVLGLNTSNFNGTNTTSIGITSLNTTTNSIQPSLPPYNSSSSGLHITPFLPLPSPSADDAGTSATETVSTITVAPIHKPMVLYYSSSSDPAVTTSTPFPTILTAVPWPDDDDPSISSVTIIWQAANAAGIVPLPHFTAEGASSSLPTSPTVDATQTNGVSGSSTPLPQSPLPPPPPATTTTTPSEPSTSPGQSATISTPGDNGSSNTQAPPPAIVTSSTATPVSGGPEQSTSTTIGQDDSFHPSITTTPTDTVRVIPPLPTPSGFTMKSR